MNLDQLKLSSRVMRALREHFTTVDELIQYEETSGDWKQLADIGEAAEAEIKAAIMEWRQRRSERPAGENVDEQAESRPKVFISHKHNKSLDVQIADHVRSFFERNSAGTVQVFQSSDATKAVPIGEAVNAELQKQLVAAEVLVLVYTREDEDWSFCMWEAGVACAPTGKNTRITALVCTEEVPRPLADKQVVRARDPENVRQFVISALTDSEFFPVHNEAITSFSAESEEVNRIADEFFTQLQQLIPHEPSRSWFFFPWLRLDFSLIRAQELQAQTGQDGAAQARDIVRNECRVESEAEVGRMLGRETLVQSSLAELEKLVEGAPWVEELCERVLAAACGKWPEGPGEYVWDQHTRRNRFMVLVARDKIPSEGRYVFHVHFPPSPADAAQQGDPPGH